MPMASSVSSTMSLWPRPATTSLTTTSQATTGPFDSALRSNRSASSADGPSPM
jgi:hypothetical protein